MSEAWTFSEPDISLLSLGGWETATLITCLSWLAGSVFFVSCCCFFKFEDSNTLCLGVCWPLSPLWYVFKIKDEMTNWMEEHDEYKPQENNGIVMGGQVEKDAQAFKQPSCMP